MGALTIVEIMDAHKGAVLCGDHVKHLGLIPGERGPEIFGAEMPTLHVLELKKAFDT